ncbi:MAG: LCP family protein, partial [Chloroflexota bacterium]|nr:LCP family protein [Chloroflexota bacterium]
MTQQSTPSPNKKRNIFLLVLGILLLTLALTYFLWFRPSVTSPISAPLSLPTRLTTVENSENSQSELVEGPSNLPAVPLFVRPTKAPLAKPVCGDDLVWTVLLVGIDYRGEGYAYGLADIIRLVQIDFVDMTVSMVPLPRDLIVEVPEGRFTVPDPFKINQTYLFGTPGMGHFDGSGGGAGGLAEAIQYNFGVSVDHYGVINFETFINLIDAIGGVEVDLPVAISGGSLGNFSAGVQTLDGERALALARIRYGYGDSFRISNQTIILRGVLKKMSKPAMLLKVPDLLQEFSGGFLTDLSVDQLTSLGICTLSHFDTQNLYAFEVPQDLLTGGSAYIPTLNNNAFVYHWDEDFVEWIHQALVAGS